MIFEVTMLPIEIKPGIYWVGVNDRITDKFEGLWSIQDAGVSYNSYFIDDEKKAIIDISKEILTEAYIGQLEEKMDLSKLDYVVINHMEPDHTGALRALRQKAPQAVLLGTKKTKEMLASFYGIVENVREVADGETLSLGSHTLKFISTPFVHWPETMMTYETSENILFSCDGFGSYGALSGSIFDDGPVDQAFFEQEALRYFSTIIATFCKPVRNAIAKLHDLPIAMVAPSHGLVWRKDPQRIISLYQQWAEYGTGAGGAGVTLVYSTMYNNTEKMMDVVAQGIADENIPVTIFHAGVDDIGKIIPALWVNQGVMIGAPTYEGGIFPATADILQMAVVKHISGKTSGRFGSHAWSGGAQSEYEKFANLLKWEIFGNYEFTGSPTLENLHEGRKFGADFARRVKETAK
jgi:flavorubredoxin